MHINTIKKVLFISYGIPQKTASTRLRLVQYLHDFPTNLMLHRVIYPRKKGESHPYYYSRLFSSILWADTIFVQKKLLRKGWIDLIKGLNKTLIYDFDDAVYDPRFLECEEKRQVMLSRFHHLLIKANKVFAGNAHLARYASSYSSQVRIIPTAISTDDFHLESLSPKSGKEVVIGWSGSGNNHYYNLSLIEDAIRQIDRNHNYIRWKIIGAQKNKIIHNIFKNLQNPVDIYDWEPPSRIPQLLKDVDIGLMPLEDNEFNWGKCPTKVYEYLCMRIVPVASPIGLNNEIIRNGKNGFLCLEPADWVEAISRLIRDRRLRESCSRLGRKLVEKQFSKNVVFPRILKEILDNSDFQTLTIAEDTRMENNSEKNFK